MQWIAPSEKDLATDTLEKRLWAAADQLRANSGLTSTQAHSPYSTDLLPVRRPRYVCSIPKNQLAPGPDLSLHLDTFSCMPKMDAVLGV
jgi:hypothetical protein